MFQRILAWIRQVMNKMLGVSNVRQATHMDVDVSSDMIIALETWERMYRNIPDWKNSTTIPLGLPAAIAGELARLTVLEVKSEVSGSTRAEYINEQYKHLLAGLQQKIEQGCALGILRIPQKSVQRPALLTFGFYLTDLQMRGSSLLTAFRQTDFSRLVSIHPAICPAAYSLTDTHEDGSFIRALSVTS